jgi:predicted DNA-binding protein YlxM (UPF0122 family)
MNLTWQEITGDELEELYYQDNLSDNEIAKKFSVTVGKVKYKRKKYGITYIEKIYGDFFSENKEQIASLNNESKERLCRDENINWITKSIVLRIFRNGPVEDIHGKGQLSQEDMKMLNRYMVDNLGMIVSAAIRGNWLILEQWLAYSKQWGGNWDDPALTDHDMQKLVFQYNFDGKNSKVEFSKG